MVKTATKKQKTYPQLGFRVSPSLMKGLKAAAKAKSTTVSAVIVESLAKYDSKPQV